MKKYKVEYAWIALNYSLSRRYPKGAAFIVYPYCGPMDALKRHFFVYWVPNTKIFEKPSSVRGVGFNPSLEPVCVWRIKKYKT